MKTAVVIFSHNANKDNLWRSVLHSYSMQNKRFATYILVDSESTDSTVAIAKEYGWNILIEKKESFNHGKTRQKMVSKLLSQGYTTAIFATQDVTLASADTLSLLENNLFHTAAGVAYARQIPRNEQSFDGFFRLRNYPSISRLKSIESINELGLMTPFCSNSLAVWDLKKVHATGGFPETEFGEDMLMGAKFLINGEKISYCAESCCLHEHHSSLRQIFMRGVSIGKLHGHNPFLKEKFGRIEACATRSIKIKEILRFIFPLTIKYLGYIIGNLQGRMSKRNLLLPVLLMIVLLINIIFCLLNIILINDTCSRCAMSSINY